ncbi:geranylgeranylglyceryl/heptaprenylglyceryl phosphate synthase [Fictibacillus phosphorivorans]|uniref:Heptaprenylglyceryl phosphate synthase n=1 Tax=Fictibacillus phosphorivorans TaxID=1221500 RepID=A0A163Q9I9_9BACL|nr:heptaprenylglyceryl phosphate synthase [Fictibacillus phosphorivorans]KZE64772.1 geranylgeranylglyceryl/heptaprenylglyceryl phosphate synthase [Fictibacillus phosphorivorans]
MFDYQKWKHVFKLDPDKELSDSDLELICESGTDAVIVGGSLGVTLDNTLDLMSRIRRYAVPCVLEVSNIESLTPGFDFYYIPTVLNAKDPNFITGLHMQALKEFGDIMNWDEILTEGYCILNPDCTAAERSNADASLSADDVVAYARLAEKMFKLPIFYLEYSGTYGDVDLVKKVKRVLEHTVLYYGGGITSAEQAGEMAEYADTVVVGNIIYDDLNAAIETVHAVKDKS